MAIKRVKINYKTQK